MTRFGDLEKGRAVSRALGLDLREVVPSAAAGGPGGASGPAGAPTGGAGAEELPVLVGTAGHLLHLRGPHGGIHAGALLALADSTAGPANGLAVLPRWVVTTNLTMRTVRAEQVGPLRVTARVLRRGRHAAVAEFTVHDDRVHDDGVHEEGRRGPGEEATATEAAARGVGPSALVAVGRLTSAALEPEGGPPPLPRPLHLSTPPVSSPVPWGELIGTRRDHDAVRLPVTDDVRNPWGIVHGGATAALVDVAALHAAGHDGAGPRSFTADVALHYLAPGRVGPLRADARVLARRPDGRAVDVVVHDEGADDRIVASAVATVREP